jgi:FkbM family methyltransferase
MFGHFEWSEISKPRNGISRRYEPVQPYMFIEMARAIDAACVLDVGANIGIYGIFSSRLPTVTTVHAWEPDTAAYAELIKNVALNKLDKLITPHTDVVSNKPGEVEFAISGPAAGINAVKSTTFHNAKHYTSSRVMPAITLDTFIVSASRPADEPTAIKIDVEGHEQQVLEGASSLLGSRKCIVQLECYRGASDIEALMARYAYKKTFTVGHEYYYSNHPKLAQPGDVQVVVEKALSALIADSIAKK